MNLNVFGGIVEPRTYGTIIAHGNVSLCAGTVCAVLEVHGEVSMHAARAGRVNLHGGGMRCDGDLQLAAVSGHGRFDVSGELQCGNIDCTGDIAVHSLVSSGNVHVTGALCAQTVRAAGLVAVRGRAHVQSIEALTVNVEPLQSRMLTRLGMDQYTACSSLGRIRAQQVRLQATDSERVQAALVSLSNRCRVQEVLFDDDLTLDDTSHVDAMQRSWPPSRRFSSQRPLTRQVSSPHSSESVALPVNQLQTDAQQAAAVERKVA